MADAINNSNPSVFEIFKKMEYGHITDSSNLAEVWASSRVFGPFIDGNWIECSGIRMPKKIFHPDVGIVVGEVMESTGEDVLLATKVSLNAFVTWSALPGHERAKHLYSIARNLEEHASLLVQIESVSCGVQTRDPRTFDVPMAIRYFYYYAGWAQLQKTELCHWKPVGVVGGITSACSALLGLTMIVAPALASGNVVCLKPSGDVPLPALLFAHICTLSGLPAGVVNVLPGPMAVGKLLVSQPTVSRVVFYGSTAVGRHVCEDSSTRNVSLLMSGKCRMLVFDSADIDSAVDAVVSAAWFNQGQITWALDTLFVQESIFEVFAEKLKVRLTRVKVGKTFDKLTDVGCPLRKEVVEEVKRIVAVAKHKGIEVFQAKIPSDLSGDKFFAPTLLIGGQAEGNNVLKEDITTPLVTMVPFRTAQEAIALSNNTRYGLAASVWTENTALALRVANKLQVGTVWVNSHGLVDASVPMAGWKQSGIGTFGGKEGLIDNMKFERESQSDRMLRLDNVGETESELRDSCSVDHAYKLYYGGAHQKSDGNSSIAINTPSGKVFAFVPEASKKDVRNAVEASATAQAGWWGLGGHSRAQILYNMAEKLQARRQAIIRHILSFSEKLSEDQASAEVDESLSYIFYWAACCDKKLFSTSETFLSGSHSVMVYRNPLGVVAIINNSGQNFGLKSFLYQVIPAICYGNTVVAIANANAPTLALEFCQILDSCNIPAGVVNVLTGKVNILGPSLADHQQINAVWVVDTDLESTLIQSLYIASTRNFKKCWTTLDVNNDGYRELFELHSTQSKAVWIPTQ